MKTKFIQLLLFLVIPTSLLSQTKDLRLNIGIPLGKYGKFDNYRSGADETNHPGFILQVEKKWKEDINIGAYIGYAGQKQSYDFDTKQAKYNYYRFGTLLSYNLNNWLSEINLSPAYSGIEIYTSIKAGFSLGRKKTTFTDLDSSNKQIVQKNTNKEFLFDLGVVLGSRYHFNESFGLYTEIGWGNAGFFTIGTTFAF